MTSQPAPLGLAAPLHNTAGAALIDVTVPHSARVYDYWLGGKDNFAADRAVATAMINALPELPRIAAGNRAFMHRVVHHFAAEEGIRQFLDIGIGLPTRPNLHEVAQAVAPDSRVVYVDNDPIVLVHARAMLAGTAEGRCEHLDADLRQPGSMLSHSALISALNLDQPVGLTLIGILMLLTDAEEPGNAVAELRDALPSGSCLAITHPIADYAPDQLSAASDIAAGAGMTFTVRSQQAVRAFFGDWELLDPGLVPAPRWRPDTPGTEPGAGHYWAAAARKP